MQEALMMSLHAQNKKAEHEVIHRLYRKTAYV